MKTLAFLTLMLFTMRGYAQVDPPSTKNRIRSANIGISTGMGGIHLLFDPVLELRLDHATLKLSPGRYCHSIGIDYEMLRSRFPTTFFNKQGPTVLLAGLYYEHQHTSVCFDCQEIYSYSRHYGIAFGPKLYFERRWSLAMKLGWLWQHNHRYSESFDSNNNEWIMEKNLYKTQFFLPELSLCWHVFPFMKPDNKN